MKRLVKIVLISALILIAVAIANYYNVFGVDVGPKQPIPFSHRIHADTKHISCFFCHPNAQNSANAGMPPVNKCLLCHKVIASKFAPINKILQYDARKQPIPWVRVVKIPDFVRFGHKQHIAYGHDCGECHGNVKAMDRIVLPRTINMDFCTSCHRKNKISVNCFICHY